MKISKQSKNIEFKTSKEISFFLTIWAHIHSKSKSKYEKERSKKPGDNYELPLGINFSEHDEKKMKEFIIQGDSFEDMISDSSIMKIYNKNKQEWEEYWEKNVERINKFIELLKEEANKFNLSLFEDLARFFETDYPKFVEVYILLGNEQREKAFQHKGKIFIMIPGHEINEKNYSKRLLSLLLHEMVHIYQDKFKKRFRDSKERFYIVEKTADCFASKGILINEHRVKREGKSLDFYNAIKEAFEKGKTISDIWDEMVELSDLNYYR